MIDIECHACYMKVRHSRHDKNRRVGNRSKYTEPVVQCDHDTINRNKRSNKNTSTYDQATKIYSQTIKSTKKTQPIEVKIKNTEGTVVINRIHQPRVYIRSPK